jgi:hypothetical protein
MHEMICTCCRVEYCIYNLISSSVSGMMIHAPYAPSYQYMYTSCYQCSRGTSCVCSCGLQLKYRWSFLVCANDSLLVMPHWRKSLPFAGRIVHALCTCGPEPTYDLTYCTVYNHHYGTLPACARSKQRGSHSSLPASVQRARPYDTLLYCTCFERLGSHVSILPACVPYTHRAS